MFSSGWWTPVTWTTGTPDPYAEFYAVEFWEYDPTNPTCMPGGAMPMNVPPCSSTSATIDIAGNNNNCMEPLGSNCNTCTPNQPIQGTINPRYYGNVDVMFN